MPNAPHCPQEQVHPNVCSLKFNAIFVPAQIYFQFYFPAFSSKFHSPLRPYMSTCTLRSLPVPALELGKGFPALDLALYVAVFWPHPSPGRKQSMGPKGNPHWSLHTPSLPHSSIQNHKIHCSNSPSPSSPGQYPAGKQGQCTHPRPAIDKGCV